jgi:hypothetical protein
MTAGYSGKSLVEKLGIKEGQRIAILNSPKGYASELGSFPKGIRQNARLTAGLDFIQFFCTEYEDLEKRFPVLKKSLATTGMLWISWPKGSSKMATTLNENFVREIGLNNGMVDVKVCAVDDVWSGLKFVFRIKDRQRPS